MQLIHTFTTLRPIDKAKDVCRQAFVCVNTTGVSEFQQTDPWLLSEDEVDIDEMDYAASTTQDKRTLKRLLTEKLRESEKNLSSKGYDRLKDIVLDNLDAFGHTVGGCSLSNLKPMKVDIKEGATPCIASARSMGHAQLKFLREKLDLMESRGVVQKVTDSTWSSPVFVVPKPGKPGEFRMVVDLRSLNDRVEKTSLPLPNLENMLTHLNPKASIFGTFDVLSGFDNMRCDPEAAKYFILTTPFGNYQMNCIPQGFKNSAQTFHTRMTQDVLGDQYMTTVLQWIDDTLLYATTEEEYLNNLEMLLKKLISQKLRLSVKKCVFATKEVEFVGRTIKIVDGKVVTKFASRFYDSILNIGIPKTAVELAQAIYTSNWLSTTIPGLTKLIDPLRQMLRQIHIDKKSSGKKKALIGVNLADYGWGDQHEIAWRDFAQAVKQAAETAVYDSTKELCLWTDASDDFFSVVITQCDPAEIDKPYDSQRHEPLYFLSGKFKGAQQNWHISSKECWPILWALKRFDWLFHGHPREFRIFCDHQNLEAILNPSGKQVENKATLSRLYRRGVLISEFTFTIKHVPGQYNVFADLLTRWGITNVGVSLAHRGGLILNTIVMSVHEEYEQFLYDRVRPLERPDFSYPTKDQILKSQKDNMKKTDIGKYKLKWNVDRYTDGTGRVFIPLDDVVLRTRIIVAAHYTTGHGSISTMLTELDKSFCIPDVKELVTKFTRLCLHCDKKPRIIRRKIGEQKHASKPNEILHADYLYVHKGYLLVIRDDLSSHVELFYTKKADAQTMAEALVYWKAHYDLPRGTMIVTDNGSHFANSLLRQLSKFFKFRHHFVVAYAPWANGTAEVTNSEVLGMFKCLLSECGPSMTLDQWPDLIPQVMMYLNHKQRRSLGGLSPNQVHLGLPKTDSSLLPFIWVRNHETKTFDIKELASKESLSKLDEFRDYLATRHKEVADLRRRIRQTARGRYNSRKGIRAVSFTIGDLVLVSTEALSGRRSKIQLNWVGPYVVTRIESDYVYEVKGMDDKTFLCHVQRMKFYDSITSVLTQEEVMWQFIHDRSQFEVLNITDARWNDDNGKFELQIEWKGLEKPTWEPVETLVQDIPDMVRSFLDSRSGDEVAARIQEKYCSA